MPEKLDKQEFIGKVRLDYTWYSGEDLYTDGEIENRLLEIAKSTPEAALNAVIAEAKMRMCWRSDPDAELSPAAWHAVRTVSHVSIFPEREVWSMRTAIVTLIMWRSWWAISGTLRKESAENLTALP